jgi:Na+-translocating ferredoxin:NAD+ oxidoreductase RNF subunit RnfB
MAEKKTYMVPNLNTPNKPVSFDESVCIGCNDCVESCRSDVLMPNPEEGKAPIVLYPDECWYCGCCVLACPFFPEEKAIAMNHPLPQRSIGWKRKGVEGDFRIGMASPPEPNTRAPVGGWRARAKSADKK